MDREEPFERSDGEDEIMMLDLQAFGWAEGEYFVLHCKSCDQDIWHCAKWTTHCRACAMKRYLAYREIVDVPLICDYDENTGKIG